MTFESNISAEVLRKQHICIPVGKARANGDLTIPPEAAGLILFESTSGQDDLLQRGFAQVLNRYKLATLLPGNGESAESFAVMADWVQRNSKTAGLHLGYFSCGSETPGKGLSQPQVRTAVICGGMMDYAAEIFTKMSIPVLLIAGGRDPDGLRSSQAALEKLGGASQLHVITGASRGFREPGVVEEAAQLAALWFLHHLE